MFSSENATPQGWGGIEWCVFLCRRLSRSLELYILSGYLHSLLWIIGIYSGEWKAMIMKQFYECSLTDVETSALISDINTLPFNWIWIQWFMTKTDKKCYIDKSIMSMLCKSVAESVLNFGLLNWYGGSSSEDSSKVKRIVTSARRQSCTVPILEERHHNLIERNINIF